MPSKESQKLPEIYVLEPDGTKIKLGEVKDCSVIDEFYFEDPWDPNPITREPQELEFTVKFRPSTETLYFITHGKLPTNNWLRMHGEGPRRRYRKKR